MECMHIRFNHMCADDIGYVVHMFLTRKFCSDASEKNKKKNVEFVFSSFKCKHFARSLHRLHLFLSEAFNGMA